MKVKHHSKTMRSDVQKQQQSQIETPPSVGDHPGGVGQSDRKWHLDEGLERQQLADELLASEQRFRITFEQAPVGMAHVDLTGRWLLVNQYLCSMLGYTEVELLECTFHAVMLTEDLPSAFAHAQSMITGELHTYQQEMHFVRKDGSQIWVNLTAHAHLW